MWGAILADPTRGSPTALVAAVIDHLPIGVVVLDERARVLCVNAYERRLAGSYVADAVGRSFFTEVAPCFEVRGLAGEFHAHVHKDHVNVETEVSFRFEHLPKPREVRLTIRSFSLASELLAAVCFQDITDFRDDARYRDVLSATTVHDLKTPLATAAFEIDAALRLLGDDAAARPLLDSARATVDRAARLATTLLDVRRLARGETVTSRIDVDLVPLADAAMRTLRPLASAQRVALALEGDASAPLACDPTLVRRALENLLDNAIRNAPEGTTVTTVVARTDRGVRVSVADRGRGVPPERRTEVFAADETSGTRSWNFGLGLALVSIVADRHGGRASVEDTPGGGATFVLELEGRVDAAALPGKLGGARPARAR